MTHNIYLNILELEEGASKTEIKAAYRRLSKQYHPDINRSQDAKEKFIEINEAYKFLIDVGPRPQTITYDQPDYGYDPQVAAYQERRRQAREYAKQRAHDAIRRQSELIKYLLRVFNLASILMLAFNILLEIDSHLPLQADDHHIANYSPKIGGNIHSNPSYDLIFFEDFTMKFPKHELKKIVLPPVVTVHKSLIFSIPVLMDANIGNHLVRFKQEYSLVAFFNLLVKLVFLSFLLYRFVFKTLDTQLSMAILITFFYLFELMIFFS
ncbi:DnaJ domain-containing protein [Reichenbachiella agarivorans]|uniref:DnaJ domain-containing protein n=1 Tax=Reichenbachiella agarivorans TaxID=2979464 RepID=UPI002916DDBA|nr:DnaJ domain-containing protein [Reichenbachiella agarivorans]